MPENPAYRINREAPVVMPGTTEFHRASGDCVCPTCGFNYYSHRKVNNEHNERLTSFRQLCNHTFVKL